MMDWFTGQVGTDATELQLDRIYEVSKYGEVRYEIEKWTEMEGTYSDKIHVRRGSPHKDLYEIPGSTEERACPPLVYQVSGNPVKFLQGHNCFGPSVEKMGPLVYAALDTFPIEVRPQNIGGGIHASRVDITCMVDLGTHEMVHEWLRHAMTRTRSRHGRPLVSGGTVYWGKHSRRWSLKAYCKYCELHAHPPRETSFMDLVGEYLRGQVRIELTLRNAELKKQKHRLSEALVWEYFDKVECGIMRSAECGDGMSLPIASRNIYRAWLNGYQVQRELSLPTFYRHRRKILDYIGVDISGDPVGALDKFPRKNLDKGYLQEREVKTVPSIFDDFLWKDGNDMTLGMS